jgi:hypothetical protein
MMLYVDAMGEFWREWVVNYDFLHQQRLGDTAVSSSREKLDRARLWLRRNYERWVSGAYRLQERANKHPRRWGGIAVALAVLLVLLVNLRAIVRAVRRHRLAAAPDRAPRLAASIWYERMTKSVARRGWPKRATQTPDEFAGSIGDAQLRDAVERFTARYERARFGESASDACALPELYEEINARD